MRYNGNRFSVYASEEKTVLGLLDELSSQVNHNTDNIEKVVEGDSNKVSHEEIKNIYKLDETGNFTGTWFGLSKPTLTDEGLKATVEELKDSKIPKLENDLNNLPKELNTFTQNSRPPKQGVLNCSNKIVYKVSDTEFRVIQKTNKQYLMYILKKGVGGNSSTDHGSNWDLLRIHQVTKVSDVFVYWWDEPIEGTVTEYVAATQGVGNYDKNYIYQDSIDTNACFGRGLSLYDIPQGSHGVWSINGRHNKKITIHLTVDSYSTDNLEISVNDKVVGNYNLKTHFGSLGNGKSVTLEVPTPLYSVAQSSYKIKLHNKGTGKLRFVGFNISRLKDHNENEMIVNRFKCFPTNQHFIKGAGANDYAFMDKEKGKWIGSYHGGERLVYGTCTWNDLTTGLSETTENGRKELSSITIGSWYLIKNFEINQITNLDDRARMVSAFNFDIDGTVEMKFNLCDNRIKTSTLYTCLTCVYPTFNYVTYPMFKIISDNLDDNDFMDITGVVDGQVSQYDSNNRLEIATRFTQFDKGYMKKDNCIWSTSNYNKHYYGVVIDYADGVVIDNLTWSKGLDFYIR